MVRSVEAKDIENDMNRALNRKSWWRQMIAESAAQAIRKDLVLQGVSLQAHFIKIPKEINEAIDTTIRRIAIGLLFDQNPLWDATRSKFIVHQVQENQLETLDKTLHGLLPLPNVCSLGSTEFHAAWGFAKETPYAGVMLMAFYGGLVFVVFFNPESHSLI
jgi:hypothetical protein